jgi:HK97 family phage prohead protease
MKPEFKSAQGHQTRTVSGTLGVETRDGAGDEFALIGYASVFNTWSHDLGGFKEIILPGTFARSLREGADVKCLFNHAPDNILGRTKSGTCTVSEDSHGLRFRCQLDKNNSRHADLYRSIKRGDIDECSFAFKVPDGGQQWAESKDENGQTQYKRTISDVDLIDVSIVTYPAYPGTEAGARAANYRGAGLPGNELTDYLRIETARKLFRSMSSEVAEIRKHPYPAPYDYACLNAHAERASELMESAYACSDFISGALDDWDDDDSRSATSDEATYRAAHASAHRSLNEAANSMAVARLALARCRSRK